MTSRNSTPDPADPPDPPETVSASAPQTLPSTRAGGQDDVSSNKLPQNTHFSEIIPPIVDIQDRMGAPESDRDRGDPRSK